MSNIDQFSIKETQETKYEVLINISKYHFSIPFGTLIYSLKNFISEIK